MAQLNKTFPRMEDAGTLVVSEMRRAMEHPNLEVLAYSEVAGIDGYIGNFEVTVRRKPRFVDAAKCTACGDCADVCPITLADEYDQGLSKRKAAFKKYAQAIPGAYGISKRSTAPCKATCPAHVSIQGYIALIREGEDFAGCRIDTSAPPSDAMRRTHARLSRFVDLPVQYGGTNIQGIYLKFEGGRYVIYNDAIHEGHTPKDFNPLLSLGLVRMVFRALLDVSAELGVDAARRAKWRTSR